MDSSSCTIVFIHNRIQLRLLMLLLEYGGLSTMPCNQQKRRRDHFPFPEHYTCMDVFQDNRSDLYYSIPLLANIELIKT